MSRKIIKTVSNEPVEFIPESQRDLDRNSQSIESCPMIFVGVKPNRDQQWLMQDMIELKDPKDPTKGIKGLGGAFKYMWENNILEVKNVEKVGDSFKGEAKNKLWDGYEGMDAESTEAVTFFYTNGKLDEEEVKT